MQRSLTGLLILAVALACGPGRATADGLPGPAGALTAAMTERLSLMEAVAWHKWNEELAIEDLARERVVLDKVVAAAEAGGVAADLATDFFQAQIAAAKQIQSRLFEDWRRAGQGRFADVPDLKAELRPAIGALTGRIIEALAALEGAAPAEVCAAIAPVPPALAEDAAAWRLAVQPLRARSGGC